MLIATLVVVVVAQSVKRETIAKINDSFIYFFFTLLSVINLKFIPTEEIQTIK